MRVSEIHAREVQNVSKVRESERVPRLTPDATASVDVGFSVGLWKRQNCKFCTRNQLTAFMPFIGAVSLLHQLASRP